MATKKKTAKKATKKVTAKKTMKKSPAKKASKKSSKKSKRQQLVVFDRTPVGESQQGFFITLSNKIGPTSSKLFANPSQFNTELPTYSYCRGH